MLFNNVVILPRGYLGFAQPERKVFGG